MRHVYNKYWLLLLSAIAINGCYTLFRHPDVEVTYNDDQTYSEEYDVLVDEDCQTCHNNIKINEHFNPETYTVKNDWSATPWWHDANYKVIFGDGIVETKQEDQSSLQTPNSASFAIPTTNANQYILSHSSGNTSSNNSQLNKSTAIDSSQADNDKNTSQKKSSSKKQNKKVKRKFKKRI